MDDGWWVWLGASLPVTGGLRQWPWGPWMGLLGGFFCLGNLPGWGQASFEVESELPMTPAERLQAGTEAYGQGAFEVARSQLTRFLEVVEGEPEADAAVAVARPLLALCCIQLRAFPEASRAIAKALEHPDLSRKVRAEMLFWKGVCHLREGEPVEARRYLGEFEACAAPADPRLHEAAILRGTTHVTEGQFAEAVEFFQGRRPTLEDSAPEVAARMMALELHALLKCERLDEALALVRAAAGQFDRFVQIVGLQALILDLGSRLLDRGRYYAAIRCLHYVWPQKRLLALQTERKDVLAKKCGILEARGGQEALLYQWRGLEQRIARELEHFSKLKGYDAASRMRLAHAYLGLGRYRQAAMLIEWVLECEEEIQPREEAFFTVMHCWMQVHHWERAVRVADRYLALAHGEATRVSEAKFLRAEAMHAAGDYERAQAAFAGCAMEDQEGALASKAIFMEGICWLHLDRYGEALERFRMVEGRFPKEIALVERAIYWRGLTHSLANESEACIRVMNVYQNTYRNGVYEAEAEFRVAFARHALADEEAAIAGFRAFLKRYPEHALVDEARLLLGDAYCARGELDQGMASYGAISPESTLFFEEGWFKTAEVLERTEAWEPLRHHLEEFVRQWPNSLRLPEALQRLASWHQRNGNHSEARKRYWDALEQYGDHSEMPGVLALVRGLETLYGGGEEREKLVRRWQAWRRRAEARGHAVAAVRGRWALARLMRSDQPIQAAVLLADGAAQLNPEETDAEVLMDTASALESLGEEGESQRWYREVIRWHPRSLQREEAEFSLGRQALKKGAHASALEHFERVEKLGGVVARQERLGLCQAECLRGLGKTEEALVELKKVLGDAEVSPSAKVQALMRSGDWLMQDGKIQEALVYFERVYLMYGRDPKLVAKAYWLRGQGLERLGEVGKAREVLEELVGREDLKACPEVEQARAWLN